MLPTVHLGLRLSCLRSTKEQDNKELKAVGLLQEHQHGSSGNLSQLVIYHFGHPPGIVVPYSLFSSHLIVYHSKVILLNQLSLNSRVFHEFAFWRCCFMGDPFRIVLTRSPS